MKEANISDQSEMLNLESTSADILERRDARAEGIPLYTANWHIFLPTFIIFVSYSIAWIFLAVTDRSDGSLARLFIVVVSIGVPILAGHAFLRYQTIRLQVNPHNLLCHPGWPKETPIDLPLDLIESVEIKRGVYGLIFDGGTIVIHLKTHTNIAIADLRNPKEVKAVIERAILVSQAT